MRIFRRRRMSVSYSDVPFGINLLQFFRRKLCPRVNINRGKWYRWSVFGLTYLAYTCYHMTRKPISVVKSVLHRNCSESNIPLGYVVTQSTNESTWCDYPPFDRPDSAALFGTLDSAFLFSYGAAMFVSGFVAERVSLRYFLTIGMLMSGIFCYMFGIAKSYDIHSMTYFIIVQGLAGIFQTTGWPGVVTVVGRWFGKAKRGLIFGIWNSHTSVGNILGTVIAAYYVETDWSMSFIMPGLLMGICGFILFTFLVDSPDLVSGLESRPGDRRGDYRRVESGGTFSDNGYSTDDSDDVVVAEQDSNPSLRSLRGSVNSEGNMRVNERSPILGSQTSTVSNSSSVINESNIIVTNQQQQVHRSNREAIGFVGALKIPGVIEFSLCLFFSKLVSYTFLYWLPLYIKSSTQLSATESADLSILFDVGGAIGAIAAGVISDYSGMPATTCIGMLGVAAPMLRVYQQWGKLSLPINVVLLFVVGILVNGPYALITTSVSAELGTHSSLEGNSKALATVTAIIDGTGSIGAAIGPLLAGIVSSSGWENVFSMLILSDVIALILLIRLVIKEFSKRKRNARIE